MQKFANVRTTAESVKPLEIDDYHVYVNTGRILSGFCRIKVRR